MSDRKTREGYSSLLDPPNINFKAKRELPPEPIVKWEGAALPREKKRLFGPKARDPRKRSVGRGEGAERPTSRGDPGRIQPFQSVVQEGPQTPKQTEKPARDYRNLVEQRNLVLARAYNEAKENKAKITAATLDKIPWIKQDPLLIKWGELSFTGALKTRPGTVKSLFSKTANRYKT